MDNNVSRYTKQMKVSQLGLDSQAQLSDSHVAIIGLGALGSTAAELIVRAGVGKVTIIDRDYIEMSNLQRQQLYSEQDINDNLPKAIAAYNRLTSINSSIIIHPIVAHLNAQNIQQILKDVDVIVDATDNFTTRYLINEFAVKEQKIWIHGAVSSTYGKVLTIKSDVTPCFNCLFPSVPELSAIDTCDTVGVLNTTVNMIAALQVTEVLKCLTSKKDFTVSHLLEYDSWHYNMKLIDVTDAKDTSCKVCGSLHFSMLDQTDIVTQSTVLCGRDTVQVHCAALNEHTYEHYTSKLKHQYELKQNKYLTKLFYKHYTVTFFTDGRCLVQGTEDLNTAESIISMIFIK